MGFPGGSDGKGSACSAGDPGSIPGSGRPPGEGNGNPLQYSCLKNPMDRPWSRKESDMTERLILMSTITNMLMDSGFLVASELLGSQEDNTL